MTIDFAASEGTVLGAALGTPGYMPPEHARTTNTPVSTAADVYSLGAILYRFLTGKTLFQDSPKKDAIRLVLESVPSAPHTLNPRVDRKLEAICLKCLAKDPANRYHSAEALAEDLDRWLNGEWPLAWTPPMHLRTWKKIRRPLLIGSLAALVGFAVAALGVFYYLDPNRLPRTLEQQARQGRLTLIGETGPPLYKRWSFGGGRAVVSTEKGESFFVSTLDRDRLELLRMAPGPRYRLSAEIRHDNAFRKIGGARVGFYFAHRQEKKDDRVTDHFCEIAFADMGPEAKLHQSAVNPLLRSAKVALNRERFTFNDGAITYPTTGQLLFDAAEKPVWRKLAVEVRPEKVVAFWEGQPLKEVPMAEMREFGLKSPRVGDGLGLIPEFDFALDGALGLLVQNGKASFRNVTIEPIK